LRCIIATVMDVNLNGRVAMITGAGHGMGQAAAKLFAANGAKVAAADVRLEAAQATVEDIASAGGQALALQVDATSDQSVAAAVGQVVETFGQVDVLWNCVGGIL